MKTLLLKIIASFKPTTRTFGIVLICLLGMTQQSLQAAANNQLADNQSTETLQPSVEELRITSAQQKMPKIVNALDAVGESFQQSWSKSIDYTNTETLVDNFGAQLWQMAKTRITQAQDFDDRPLYWQRLKMSHSIRTEKTAYKINQSQRKVLLQRFERASRGMNNINFAGKTTKKIFLSGFDPFLLDRNIEQSNPSGITALLLDGMVIQLNGISAEINTIMIPVRYADFDQGLIEQQLAPLYATNSVDLIVTVSMGRENFDLERFPSKRRSAAAPDNLNLFSGGSKTAPIISRLNQIPLPGAEFVEFSLPVKAMQKAKGEYVINDNHQVTTLTKSFSPTDLSQLSNETAVEGSGGGYLSNEISYRSIRLRNQLNSNIPTGHIHTPRIQTFDTKSIQAIVTQIEQMLQLSLTEI